MLEAVGFPVAVNPETRLAALARKRGWLVENFEKAPGAPEPALPIGPMWHGGGRPGLLTRGLTSDAWGGEGPHGHPGAAAAGGRSGGNGDGEAATPGGRRR